MSFGRPGGGRATTPRECGVGLAIAVLLALALWLGWPRGDSTMPAPVAVTAEALDADAGHFQSASTRATAARAESARTDRALADDQRGPLRLRVHAAAGCPPFGLVRLLRRPEFAPNVRLDVELWSAFASGGRGDLTGLASSVFDRLARLGWESVVERAWTDGVPVEVAGPVAADACLAVALSARSVGYARVGRSLAIDLSTFGAAELRVDGDGELWAWSDSDFVGPHKVSQGSVVPAARTCAVQLARAPNLRLRFFQAVQPEPGRTVMLVATPRAVDRELNVAAGELRLSPAPPPVPAEHLLLSLAALRTPTIVALREEGTPWGCYVECGEQGPSRVLATPR
jgi:hypothetical protein